MAGMHEGTRGTAPRQTGSDAAAMSVIGLVPRSVQLHLDPCQLPGLKDELLTSIESRSGSMREEHERQGATARRRLRDGSEDVVEHSMLLRALAADDEPFGDDPVSVTASMEVAYELVRGCAHNAAARLVELVGEHHSDRTELLRASTAAAAWTITLVDLRYLDEEGPDDNGL